MKDKSIIYKKHVQQLIKKNIYYFNILTLTASSIFCYFLENNKIYVILQAYNWFIIEECVILKNNRNPPGGCITL